MDKSPISPATRVALNAYRERTAQPHLPPNAAALLGAVEQRERRQRRALGSTGLVLALVVVALGWGLSRRTPTVEVVQASPSARWRLQGDALVIFSGDVRVAPRTGRQINVQTPDLSAQVFNAAAMFQINEGATTLVGESGEVVWRAGKRQGTVGPGERMTLNTPGRVLTVPAPGPRLDGCAEASDDRAYEACLATAARGSGLAAETAMFELGTLAHRRNDKDAAIRWFRTYGERFPLGPFGPEASIGLMVGLEQLGATGAASDEAKRFLDRFPNEPRAARVRQWAQQIP